jgi:hypothetical protein
MNKTITIVIEDKKKATEKGLLKKIKEMIKDKFYPKRRFQDYIIESLLSNGDAITLDFGKSNYQVEKEFFNYSNNSYQKSARAFSVSDENTLLLMRDWNKIVNLLLDSSDLYDDNTTVIKIRRSTPKPTVKVERIHYKTVDPVYIYRDYVRVGFDSFKRHFDPWSGDSYVKVDGKKFYIDCDRYGKEYLSE